VQVILYEAAGRQPPRQQVACRQKRERQMQSHKSRAACGCERNGLKTASCGVDVLLFCIAAPEHFPWAL